MQTFLPYPDFELSACCLDRQRLGKQRIEAKQILRVLLGESTGWQNHPAVRMWHGHEITLCVYGMVICDEWINRGYNDQQWDWFYARYQELVVEDPSQPVPSWLGDEAFHLSHRSNLLRKNPDHYRQFWSDTPDDLPYIWPKEQ